MIVCNDRLIEHRDEQQETRSCPEWIAGCETCPRMCPYDTFDTGNANADEEVRKLWRK